MQLIQNGKTQFIDQNGAPLAGGTVGFYFVGTLNPKATFQDQAGTISNTNPVLLDSRGQAVIWGNGNYRQIVKDANGVTIWDQIAVAVGIDGAGDFTDEGPFVAGTDFTPGTTTTLTLVGSYGSSENLWVDFDGTPQHDFSLSGQTLTFPDPIPVGISEVYVKGGIATPILAPGAGTVTDTSVAAGANINTSKLLYSQGSPGAVSRTQTAKNQDIISVKDFGAKGDGATDDTAAMAAAHATGRTIYYPAGDYHFDQTIVFSTGGIVGDGPFLTLLTFTDTGSLDAIQFTGVGNQVPIFRDFLIQGTALGSKAAGSGINVTNPTSSVGYPMFSNIQTLNLPRGFTIDAAANFKVDNCDLLNFTDCGIHVANVFNPDAGDSNIVNSFFYTAATSGNREGIHHESSGGLKLLGNKFNGLSVGYHMAYDGAIATGVLIINGNSFENCAGYNLLFERVGPGSGSYGAISITGNEIQLAPNNISFDNSGAFTQVAITGNVIATNNAAGQMITMGFVTVFSITGNTFIGQGGTSKGIVLAANTQSGVVGLNQYYNTAIPIENDSNFKSSIAIQKRVFDGTVPIACTTGAGSLFTGTATISAHNGAFQSSTIYGQISGGGGNACGGGFESISPSSAVVRGFAAASGTFSFYYSLEADF